MLLLNSHLSPEHPPWRQGERSWGWVCVSEGAFRPVWQQPQDWFGAGVMCMGALGLGSGITRGSHRWDKAALSVVGPPAGLLSLLVSFDCFFIERHVLQGACSNGRQVVAE